MSKKIVIVISIAILACLGTLATFFIILPKIEEQKLVKQLASNDSTKRDFERILEREKKLKDNPQDVEQYTGLAFNWKSIADTLNDKKFYEKALEAAIEGLDRFPRHAVLNMNAGNLYKELGKYEDAEKRFRKAIESAPGDPQTYLLLIDLYKYNLKKSETEIVKVYQEGLSRLVNTLPLLNSFAAYLRDTGQKQRALEFYRELSKALPDNKAYKIAIEELEKDMALGG